MEMISKIICPTDFSINSSNSVRYGYELAKVLKAELVLFHCIESKYKDAFDDSISREKEKALKELDSIADGHRIRDKYGNVTISSIVSAGNPANEIIKTIKAGEGNLVVMATKGVSERYAPYSRITSDVIERTCCPVLEVPPGTIYEPIQKIVYTSELSGEDEKEVVDFVVELGESLHAHIDFLTIQDQEASSNADDLISYGYNNFLMKSDTSDVAFFVLEKKDIIKGINDFTERQEGDLIIISPGHEKLYDNFIEESSTHQLVNKTSFPVLVMHKNKECLVTA